MAAALLLPFIFSSRRWRTNHFSEARNDEDDEEEAAHAAAVHKYSLGRKSHFPTADLKTSMKSDSDRLLRHLSVLVELLVETMSPTSPIISV